VPAAGRVDGVVITNVLRLSVFVLLSILLCTVSVLYLPFPFALPVYPQPGCRPCHSLFKLYHFSRDHLFSLKKLHDARERSTTPHFRARHLGPLPQANCQ